MNSKDRTVTSRQYQHELARISKRLKPGESITITNRGQRIGSFTREARKNPALPDFYANPKKLGHSQKLGQQMIDEIVNGLS